MYDNSLNDNSNTFKEIEQIIYKRHVIKHAIH